MDVERLGAILGIWAHPDDEAFLSAGTMAAAIANGQRVVCVTATRGEGGSPDPDRYPPEKMGAIREEEMDRSLARLGVTEHHWLDYVDGTCDRVSSSEGVERAAAFISEVQPDTILTFGPDGMTGHADHRSVSSWATQAFAVAAKRGARLYHATMTPEWVARWREEFQRFDVFQPGTPPVTPTDQLGIDHRLGADLLGQKMAALWEHASQITHMREAFGDDVIREAHTRECYRLAGER